MEENTSGKEPKHERRLREGSLKVFTGNVGIPCILFLLSLIPAALLRLIDLDNRPMHCDEAVHAIKFGQLFEEGDYAYDPFEYHGPSLNYLTLPVVWTTSVDRLVDVTESHLRLVPALLGISLVAFIWLLRRQLGLVAAFFAATLTAVSPAMVFYSRYYIQEMLLVFFTFGAIVMFLRYRHRVRDARFSRQVVTLALMGLCLGMMHASKETCVIPLFAIAVAAFLTRGKESCLLLCSKQPAPLLLVSLAALTISALLFSSFLVNPRGIVDSFATYYYYVVRAAGEGSVGSHVHPWYYYFRVLFWWDTHDGPLWTEATVALLALVGIIVGVVRKGISPGRVQAVRFLGIYTIIVTLAYSVLPYKTPWCALGMLHGMILLAGVGAAAIIGFMPGWVTKTMSIAVLGCIIAHLAWQAHRASFIEHDVPTTPYVYAHTTSDVPVLCRRIEKIAHCHEDGLAMHIQVICPSDDFWPLPWYLRRLSRIGWYSDMPRDRDGPLPGAPLIITQPAMETAMVRHLYEELPPGQRSMYMALPGKENGEDWQLRPFVPLHVFLRSDLWEAYEAAP